MAVKVQDQCQHPGTFKCKECANILEFQISRATPTSLSSKYQELRQHPWAPSIKCHVFFREPQINGRTKSTSITPTTSMRFKSWEPSLLPRASSKRLSPSHISSTPSLQSDLYKFQRGLARSSSWCACAMFWSTHAPNEGHTHFIIKNFEYCVLSRTGRHTSCQLCSHPS